MTFQPRSLCTIFGKNVTAKDMQVMQGISEGLSTKEIAEIMNVKARTIKGRLHDLYGMYGFDPKLNSCRAAMLKLYLHEIDNFPKGDAECQILFTPRELEVLALVASTISNKSIAIKLKVKVTAIRNYFRNIFDKTGTFNRLELTNWCWAHANYINEQRAILLEEIVTKTPVKYSRYLIHSCPSYHCG